jgi:hypothetical protein
LEHKSWNKILARATSPNNEEAITYVVPPPFDVPVILFVPTIVADCTLVTTATITTTTAIVTTNTYTKTSKHEHEETNVAMVT